MNSIEFGKKCRPYNVQYRDIFGYVPCPDDYKCSQEEYFDALLKSIETKEDISALIPKKVIDYSDNNKRYRGSEVRGGSEVSSSEVSETHAAETGGDTSEATQEAAKEQNMSGIVYCDKTPDLPLGHLAIIDGKSTMTSSDFLYCVGEQLKFPDAQNCNWDAYLDWMRDLSWLDTKSISIVILNFDSFLCKEPDNLKYFSSDLEEVVFPFWQNDAESVFESQDAVKDITVYCVRSELTTNEQVTTKEAMSIMRQNALNGQKTPHSTSQPVLRLYDGKVCFAAFVFFYDKEQLQSAMVNRPTMWVIGDLKTGEIVQRYLCSDNEFSDSEYQKLYNISAKDVLTASKLYWDSAYALMDLIRHEYASCGTLNKKLYKEYLERISCTTPEEYRVFYKDLNNIEMEDDFMDTEKKLPTDEVAEQA